MTTEESKLLIQLDSRLGNLIDTMKTLTQKVEKLQNEHVGAINTRMAIQEEKVSRLERIIYGLIAIVVAQLIAMVFNFLPT